MMFPTSNRAKRVSVLFHLTVLLELAIGITRPDSRRRASGDMLMRLGPFAQQRVGEHSHMNGAIRTEDASGVFTRRTGWRRSFSLSYPFTGCGNVATG